MAKRAGDPLDVLPSIHDYLDLACRKSWFVAGHTRAATRGKATDENAHPFRYGRIIGAHNGIVSAPKEYAVDSMFLFDRLNQCKGDYQSAFADVAGWWGLTWFDGERFYIQAFGAEIAIARKGRTWYYSSDWRHLDAVAKFDDCAAVLDFGDTIAFDCKGGDYETLAPFTQCAEVADWEWEKELQRNAALEAKLRGDWEWEEREEREEDWELAAEWEEYLNR
jgi:hypothetical protein